MTATDRLRALQDARVVEHYDGTERTLWGYEQTGENTGSYRFAASETSGGFLQFDMFRITPEQAVEATLGNDGAAELQTENAKLREQIHWLKQGDILHVLTDQEYIDQCEREHLMQVSIDALDKENAKLRELVRDMWHEGMCECGSRGKCASCEYEYPTRMRDLGIEVDG